VLVVTFIALLELAKETLIEITQAEAFAPSTCAWPTPRPEACGQGGATDSSCFALP
jgi:chromatin segregation and condensation protein Rec8/ScpA/Scc1 (kleisin family)